MSASHPDDPQDVALHLPSQPPNAQAPTKHPSTQITLYGPYSQIAAILVSNTHWVIVLNSFVCEGSSEMINGTFPLQGAGRFSLQRCGTGRVSTAKSGHDPDCLHSYRGYRHPA